MQLVAALSRAGVGGFSSLTNYASSSYKRLKIEAPSREVVMLGLILASVQILDGILTGIGVQHFGTGVEGNALIRFLMEQFGFIPALILTKSLAVMIVAALCMLSSLVVWLKSALRVVIGIYLAAAIVPWTAVLLYKIA